MLYREVPKNGDKLSVLGYGCMRFPVRMGSINQKLAEKQILYALDQGINYFDSARVYADSELYYGYIWKEQPELRAKVFQASKSPSRDRKSMLCPGWK